MQQNDVYNTAFWQKQLSSPRYNQRAHTISTQQFTSSSIQIFHYTEIHIVTSANILHEFFSSIPVIIGDHRNQY